ncbi:hypothetical protein SNEBB_002377 [Seison nebaliae]|nr:hypothetical protein SNEBB_002377 [Seison nebaliae]
MHKTELNIRLKSSKSVTFATPTVQYFDEVESLASNNEWKKSLFGLFSWNMNIVPDSYLEYAGKYIYAIGCGKSLRIKEDVLFNNERIKEKFVRRLYRSEKWLKKQMCHGKSNWSDTSLVLKILINWSKVPEFDKYEKENILLDNIDKIFNENCQTCLKEISVEDLFCYSMKSSIINYQFYGDKYQNFFEYLFISVKNYFLKIYCQNEIDGIKMGLTDDEYLRLINSCENILLTISNYFIDNNIFEFGKDDEKKCLTILSVYHQLFHHNLLLCFIYNLHIFAIKKQINFENYLSYNKDSSNTSPLLFKKMLWKFQRYLLIDQYSLEKDDGKFLSIFQSLISMFQCITFDQEEIEIRLKSNLTLNKSQSINNLTFHEKLAISNKSSTHEEEKEMKDDSGYFFSIDNMQDNCTKLDVIENRFYSHSNSKETDLKRNMEKFRFCNSSILILKDSFFSCQWINEKSSINIHIIDMVGSELIKLDDLKNEQFLNCLKMQINLGYDICERLVVSHF